MTRQGFIDEITVWDELIDFCYNEECDICEDIISNGSMCEAIEEELVDAAREYSWRELRDALNSIDTDYDYYRREGVLSYYPVDDSDFDDYKDDVLEWMDNGGYWDDEEDDEDYDDPDWHYAEQSDSEGKEEEELPMEDEDFSINDLMGMCSVQFLRIQRDTAQGKKQSDKEFQLYLNNMPKVLQ